MHNTPGAEVRQSHFASKLATLEPDGATALALAALALLDAINAGTRALLESLYPLQDALHGASDALPAALAGFLKTVGGENHG